MAAAFIITKFILVMFILPIVAKIIEVLVKTYGRPH